MISDEHTTTIQLTQERVKGMLAKLVERWLIFHIRINRRELANLIYPDSLDADEVRLTAFEPITNTNQRPFGYYTKGKAWKRIYGWHGDVGLLVNGKEHGKRAIIFEVKFGHIQISAPQHIFFQKVVNDPGSCLKKLIEAKVIIVHCFDLDLEKNQLTTRWHEYHPPRELNENQGSESLKPPSITTPNIKEV